MWWCCSCFSKTYEAPEVLELDFRHASLTEVPAEVFTFERTLEKLYLDSNQISDLPPSLFHCHELKELSLHDNELSVVPSAIGSLTRLTTLDLSRNAISEVSDSIKNCKNLRYLDLSVNQLIKLPEGVSQLVNLEELFLSDTYLEYLMANFGRLTKLKILELRENSLQSLPKSMNRLTQLQRLDIGQNDISELPEVIGTMAHMTELWCDNNSIRTIPKLIGNLTKLTCMDFSSNELEEISEDIGKCSLLSDVTLNGNSLKTLPESFVTLENISVLRLDKNHLEYLPDQFGNMKSLEELSVSDNNLRTIPSSIGLLRKLRTLYIDNNLLVELPPEIGSCQNLSVLSAAKNRLQHIPSEVGHLGNLHVLSLAGNLLVNLPVSILNIPSLGAIWLSQSQSKPLLPLNQEIDPETNQHVLTCYLLPQLRSYSEEEYSPEAEEEDRGRRSRPSIKFVTDMELPVVETNANKRGLLRAPTPYPKELRALAKHASHLRQSRDLNGDVLNSNEPKYEGDEDYQPEESHRPDISALRREFLCSTHTDVEGNISSEPPRSSVRPITSKIGVEARGPLAESVRWNKTSNLDGNSSYIQGTTTTQTVEHNIGNTTIGLETSRPENIRFENGTQVEDKNSRDSYNVNCSDIARKSPPPYHVAARRAAFFRSSGGAGSSGIPGVSLDFKPPTTYSPAYTGRLFPMPSTEDSGSNSKAPEDVALTQEKSNESPTQGNDFVDSMHPEQPPESLSSQPVMEERKMEFDSRTIESVVSDIVNSKMHIRDNVQTIDSNSAMQSYSTPKCEYDSKESKTVEQSVQNQVTTLNDDSTYEVLVENIQHTRESTTEKIETKKEVPVSPSSVEKVKPGVNLNSPASNVEGGTKIPKFGTPKSQIPQSFGNKKSESSVVSSKDGVNNNISHVGNYNSRLSNLKTSGTGSGDYVGSKIPKFNTETPEKTRVIADKPRLPPGKPETAPKPVFLDKNVVGSKIPAFSNANELRRSDRDSGLRAQAPGNTGNISNPKVDNNLNTSLIESTGGSKIPKAPDSNKQEVRRTSSGSKIPKFNDNTKSQNDAKDLPSNRGGEGSKIPTNAGRKPWIFGTHKNARVVPLEHHKVGDILGFEVGDSTTSSAVSDGSGIYIVSIDGPDSVVKVGDKLLQVDGIDVSNMGVEIVQKILGNCQESINLLVSRHC